MIEDIAYGDQEADWSRRGSRIILDDDHEEEERMATQTERIVHKGFFNGMCVRHMWPFVIAPFLITVYWRMGITFSHYIDSEFQDDFDDKDIAWIKKARNYGLWTPKFDDI